MAALHRKSRHETNVHQFPLVAPVEGCFEGVHAHGARYPSPGTVNGRFLSHVASDYTRVDLCETATRSATAITKSATQNAFKVR